MKLQKRYEALLRLAGALLVCGGVALRADSPFNGRWDITVTGNTSRAWWLELHDTGTPQANGTFVSDYSGDRNKIDEISVSNGELTFGFHHRSHGQEIHDVYTARIRGNKLIGTFKSGSPNKPSAQWIGVRAPIIRDKDDGSWKEGKPVVLFNHKDTSGWHSLTPNKTFGWSVENGILKSTGHASNLVSNRKFWNFKLHVEFNVGPNSNSGIGLRARYEVQILDDYGKPPNTHGAGALYSRILPSENASKPAGEWQTYDIRLVGRQVTVVFNGKTVIDKGEIEGLTAIASDSNEALPGPITLQGDHGPVQFREVVLTPLTRK